MIPGLVKKATGYRGRGKSGVDGKKALQKSLYFLNQKIRRFGFDRGYHGPFSGEIRITVKDPVENGHIRTKETPAGREGAFIHHMTLLWTLTAKYARHDHNL